MYSRRWNPAFLSCHHRLHSITLKDCPGQGQASVTVSQELPVDLTQGAEEANDAKNGRTHVWLVIAGKCDLDKRSRLLQHM